MTRAKDIISLFEGGKYSLNVATVPLKEARAYAEKVFEENGKSLDEVLPDFDANYLEIQKRTKKAPDIPRIEMHVIEPTDMDRFENDLLKGRLDIFRPHAGGLGKPQFPIDLIAKPKEAKNFLTLGVKDGDKNDDRIKAKILPTKCSDLLPTQSQIWLEKLVGNIAKFGKPKNGSTVTESTIIVSREGYILDGHHRFGQVMLTDPSIKMRALRVPLDIDFLVKLGRSYGNAIGNKQKA